MPLHLIVAITYLNGQEKTKLLRYHTLPVIGISNELNFLTLGSNSWEGELQNILLVPGLETQASECLLMIGAPGRSLQSRN